MNVLASPDHSIVPALGAVLGASDFREIAAIMQREARIALAPQKAMLVRSRLARRLRHRGLSSYRDYLALVRHDSDEKSVMIEALTTNHTHFFRERHHFDHLHEHLIPQLRALPAGRPIRIWSSAGSSGEEVYSIAMCLLGQDAGKAQWARRADLRLLATDISAQMVEATRAGIYGAQAVAAIPQPYRAMWTRPHGTGIAIADDARALVIARRLNLFDPWPMHRRFDAIFCRNTMIYFDDDAKIELEARLIEWLVPGGFLYIGHAERLQGPGRDFMIPCGQTIYRKAREGEARR